MSTGTEILQKEDPILREKAVAVPVDEITSPHIKKVIADMAAAMAEQKDGIAIAAPQIGVSLQIFVVSNSLLQQALGEEGATEKTRRANTTDISVYINPTIVKTSREKKDVEEGCLSVRWLYGKVKRATKVTIRAYNEKGEKIERGASDLLAQIFQHEIDHLNGVLFIDDAHEIWEMSDEEIQEMQAR
jgi:peptide deformylase